MGFLALTFEGFRMDGLALRRSQEGRLYLAFPARRDSAGREHPYYRPLSDETRRALERQVLAALAEGGAL